MAEAIPNRRSPTTLLTLFAALTIVGDVMLLTFSATAQGLALVLIAKYPAAVIFGVVVTGGRRLAARAAEICADDLRD